MPELRRLLRFSPRLILLAAAGLLWTSGHVAAQQPALTHEIAGAGVTVRWTVEGEPAGFLVHASDGSGRPILQESLPGSVRELFLPVWLEQGEEAQVRVFVRTGSGFADQGLSATIKGPFSETALEASGAASVTGPTSCTVKASVQGGAAEVRIFSGPARVGSIPEGAAETAVEGLSPGTRYELALIPFSKSGDRELRGRRTMLPPFRTALAGEWVPCNGGARISGGEAVEAGFVCPGFVCADKDGNLLFCAPHVDSGGSMARFNSKSRKWEVQGVEGWTDDKTAPPRPAFDGLFRPKSFLPFRDPKGGLHAIVDAYTSSGKEILDIHGSLHHFRWTGSEWEQYAGGVAFSRYDSRPLFNTWTGSGAGWGFAINDKDQVGLAVHVNGSLSSNGRLIAVRLDFRDPKETWSVWNGGKWQAHSWSASFLPDPAPPKELEDNDPRVACIDGKSQWLVLFRRTPKAGAEASFWTALHYDDARTKWSAWAGGKWAEGGKPEAFLETGVEPRTVSLHGAGNGRVVLLGQSGRDLIRIEYDHKASKWKAPETLARLARPSKYGPEYKTAISPQGALAIAYSEDGYSASVHGAGRVVASTEPVTVSAIGFLGQTRVLFYLEGKDLKAASERPIPGEKASAAPPFPTSAEKEPDPSVAAYEGSFINFAQDPVVPQGQNRPVTPSYGPQLSGHMAATPDGTVFAPRFTVCNLCIFPPGHPKDPASFWGGFWDYFLFPMGVAVDAKRGKVYVSHRVTSGGCGGILGGSVEIWDLAESGRCHWQKPGLQGASRTEEYKPGRINDTFRWPCGMAADAERGFLYVANALTCDVRKFDVSGPEPKRIGILGDGVLDFPRGVAVAPDGTVYVVDSRHHRVCVFGADGKHRSSFGGPGRAPGRFLYPWGIAVDPVSGLVFVSDPQNGRVQAFEKDGRLADWWNRFKAAEFGAKPAAEGPVRVPFASSGPPGNHDQTFGLCCDARGYLYAGTGPYVARFKIARGK